MASGQIFQLEQDEELRIEVDFQKSESVSVELRSGMAEIFGTEMVQGTEYKFQPGSKFAIFTYHGCQIMVKKIACSLFGIHAKVVHSVADSR